MQVHSLVEYVCAAGAGGWRVCVGVCEDATLPYTNVVEGAAQCEHTPRDLNAHKCSSTNEWNDVGQHRCTYTHVVRASVGMLVPVDARVHEKHTTCSRQRRTGTGTGTVIRLVYARAAAKFFDISL